MRFLLLCPVALLLLAALSKNIPTATAMKPIGVPLGEMKFRKDISEESSQSRERCAETKALEEKNRVLVAKLKAAKAKITKLQKSKRDCPAKASTRNPYFENSSEI